MYRTILAATDGSPTAMRAAKDAGMLAGAIGASLILVVVTEPPPTFASSEIGWSVPTSIYDDIRRANVDKSRAILKAALDAVEVPAKTIHVENQQPAAGILQAAADAGADLIIMGSHGYQGLQKLLLGSEAAKVVAMATVPVLIVK